MLVANQKTKRKKPPISLNQIPIYIWVKVPHETSSHQRNKGTKFNSETWLIFFKHRSFTKQKRLHQQSLNQLPLHRTLRNKNCSWQGVGGARTLHADACPPPCLCLPAAPTQCASPNIWSSSPGNPPHSVSTQQAQHCGLEWTWSHK